MSALESMAGMFPLRLRFIFF